jgi:transposase
MKSILIQFGVRDFKTGSRNAAQKLKRRANTGGRRPATQLRSQRFGPDRTLSTDNQQIRTTERERLRLQRHPEDASNAMVLLLARIIGSGMEIAEQLVREILSRNLGDRKTTCLTCVRYRCRYLQQVSKLLSAQRVEFSAT